MASNDMNETSSSANRAGVITLDCDNLVDDNGNVQPEVINGFGGAPASALLTLHSVITNELGNRGLLVRG